MVVAALVFCVSSAARIAARRVVLHGLYPVSDISYII